MVATSCVGLRLVTVSSPFLDRTTDEADLEALTEKVEAPSVATAVIESNDVVPALLDAADDHGLLCLETRAHGPLAAIVLGSTASELVHMTTRPVLLVGPAADPDAPIEILEVCVDRPDATAALPPTVGTWGRDIGLPALGSVAVAVAVAHATRASVLAVPVLSHT